MQNVPLSPGVFRRKPAWLQFERKQEEEEELLQMAGKAEYLGQYFKKKKRVEKLKLRLKPKVFHQLFPQLPHRLNRVLLVIMSVLL